MVNLGLKPFGALNSVKKLYKTYAVRPFGENWTWKEHKIKQNEFLSAKIKELSPIHLRTKHFVKVEADKILNDPQLPGGIGFQTLAVALVHEYPTKRNIVKKWYADVAWDEVWKTEGFTDFDKKIQEGIVKDEIILKRGKNGESTDVRYNAFCGLFPQGEGKILEAGSGVSKIVINWPAGAPNRKAVGIDNSSEAIRVAPEAVNIFKRSGGKYGDGSMAEFRNGNIFNMKVFGGDFDACFNSGVLEHFLSEKQRSILKEMANAVKIGGKVIVSVPNYSSPSTMIRRWMNGAKRRNSEGSDVHLWWPFPNEQPQKTRELKELFKSMNMANDGVEFTNIESSGFNPFHNFMTKNLWKYKRVYGRTSRYFSAKEISERELPRFIKGDYIWYQPKYTPVMNFIGKTLDLMLTKPIDMLFNNWFSKHFGNQIIVWGTKISSDLAD
jgi:SAM-dependent methyltransferase